MTLRKLSRRNTLVDGRADPPAKTPRQRLTDSRVASRTSRRSRERISPKSIACTSSCSLHYYVPLDRARPLDS